MIPNASPSGPGVRQSLSRADVAARSRMDQSLDGKANPQEVNYRPSESPDQRCGICVYFTVPHSCIKVAGNIDESGVCDLFKADEDESNESATEESREPMEGMH